MNTYYKGNDCENILECSIFKINSSRLNHVQPNVAYEEQYLYEQEKTYPYLDLKLCAFKQKKVLNGTKNKLSEYLSTVTSEENLKGVEIGDNEKRNDEHRNYEINEENWNNEINEENWNNEINEENWNYEINEENWNSGINEENWNNGINEENWNNEINEENWNNEINEEHRNDEINDDEKRKRGTRCTKNNIINYEQTVFSIVRQWVEREIRFTERNDEKTYVNNHSRTTYDNSVNIKHKMQKSTSFVIIGVHSHANSQCLYEEYTIEIADYDVEKDGCFVQIHVNRNHTKILLLSNRECVLVQKRAKEKTFVLKGILILRKSKFNIFKKKKIIKAEWSNKMKNVIALLTYEYVPASKSNEQSKCVSIFRLINVGGACVEEVKIILPDMDSIEKRVGEQKTEVLNDIVEDLYLKQGFNSMYLSERSSERMFFSKENCFEKNETEKRHLIDMDIEQKRNMIPNWDHSKKPELNDVNEEDQKMIENNLHNNLVVDFCFGGTSENVVWLECCVFFLYRNGIILIYSPVMTRKCYISYYLLYEINSIRKGRKEVLEYCEPFLQMFNYFENCFILNYRMNCVYMQFKKKKSKNYIYTPYVINALPSQCYTNLNIIRYNDLIFLCVCDNLGCIHFLYFSYYITPLILRQNEKEFCCDRKFYFNLFLNKYNVNLNQMSLLGFSELLNNKSYRNYFNQAQNKYKLNRIVEKIEGDKNTFMWGPKKKKIKDMDDFGRKEEIEKEEEEEEEEEKEKEDRNDEFDNDEFENDELKNDELENRNLKKGKEQRESFREIDKSVHRKKPNEEISFFSNGILQKTNELYNENIQLSNGYMSSEEEVFIFRDENEENRKERIKKETYRDLEMHTKKLEEGYFSCYESYEELVLKELSVLKDLRLCLLPIAVFDSYDTGMKNVRCIVLQDINMLCFNSKEIKILHLVWLKFVLGIFFLLYKQNYIFGKLLYHFCISQLYMITEIYKTRIHVTDFNYTKYIKMEHCNILSPSRFAMLFKNKNILSNYKKNENFHVYQSRVLYDVGYILYPIFLEDTEPLLFEKKRCSVYFVFTHYINTESQRKQNLFLKKYINFLTCAHNKNLFLIYDCFHVTLSPKPITVTNGLTKEKAITNTLSSTVANGRNHEDMKNDVREYKSSNIYTSRLPQKRVSNNGEKFVLIKPKQSNFLCRIRKDITLRTFIISSVLPPEENSQCEQYKKMFENYLRDMLNDYSRSFRNESQMFYIDRTFSVFQDSKYLQLKAKRDRNRTKKRHEGTLLMEKYLSEQKKLLREFMKNESDTHIRENGNTYEERVEAIENSKEYSDENSNEEVYTLLEQYKIHDKETGRNKERSDIEKTRNQKEIREGETIIKRKNIKNINKKKILSKYVDMQYIRENQNLENHPYYSFIQLLHNTFTLMDVNSVTDEENGTSDKENHIGIEYHEKKNDFARNVGKNQTGYELHSLELSEQNVSRVIKLLKEKIIQKYNLGKDKNTSCEELIRKLVKIKYDYNDVKDYYIRKNKIRINFTSNEEKQIKMLEHILRTYYFFADLNAHYQKKFEKTERAVYNSLAHKIIQLVQRSVDCKNAGKALQEKHASSMKTLHLCFEKQKLINQKFVSILVKKRKYYSQADYMNILKLEAIKTRCKQAAIKFYNFLLVLQNAKNEYNI